MSFQDVIIVVILITTLALTPSWLGCHPPVPHQDHSCCEVSQGGIRGGLFSADPHLWGPGREWLSCSELRPGPDPATRSRLQVRAWHQRRHERAGHRYVLCHHGYVLPTPPLVIQQAPPCAYPSLHPATRITWSLPSSRWFLPFPSGGVAPVPILLLRVSPAVPRVGAGVPQWEFPMPGCYFAIRGVDPPSTRPSLWLLPAACS